MAGSKDANGQDCANDRTVSNNSGFGCNRLLNWTSKLDATRVESLTITEPTGQTIRDFRALAADRAIGITEGAATIKDPSQHPRRPRPC